MRAGWRAVTGTGRGRVAVLVVAGVIVVGLVAAGLVALGRRSGERDAGRWRHPDRSGSPTGPPSSPGSPTPGPSASASPSGPSSSATGRPPAGAIWRPRPGTTWQWQIVGAVAAPFRDVTMYDVDLTDAVPRDTTVPVPGFGQVRWPKGANAGIVDQLHAAGKVAVCYLDTGAWESYEPDAELFPGRPGSKTGTAQSVIGNDTGWENEHWLDIRAGQRERFAPIMWARFDLARSIGCDGVEPDQNNPHGNDPGPPISLADEKSWYLEVARQAHARGLSVGMKNGVEVTDADTVTAFDWNLNEECFYFAECGVLDQFVRAGKAVFSTEYTDDWSGRGFADAAALARSPHVCADARKRSFTTLIKNKTPDALFVAC